MYLSIKGLAQWRRLTHLEHKSPFDRLGRPYHGYVSISKDAAWHSVEEPKKPAAVAAYDVSSTSVECVHTYVCTYISVCAHVCVSTAKYICFSLEMLVQSVRNISLLVNIHTIMHTYTHTHSYILCIYVSMYRCFRDCVATFYLGFLFFCRPWVKTQIKVPTWRNSLTVFALLFLFVIRLPWRKEFHKDIAGSDNLAKCFRVQFYGKLLFVCLLWLLLGGRCCQKRR